MDEASIGAALEAIRDRLLAENSTGEPDGIDEKTTRLDLALELFFERILPSHKVLSEQDVLKSLRDSACSVNPKYVLRTPSLEVLKEAMMKMVTLWDDEYPIYQYEVRNWAICISKLNDVALFGTRGRKPFSDEIRWRVISVWKTRRDYVAWSGFPWP